MWKEYLQQIQQYDIRTLARCISLIENEAEGYESLMQILPNNTTPIIGITGPPGAGKSTIVDVLISLIINDGKRVAVLCVDPSSPFNLGALLGDRVRMNQWHSNSDVYIRSLASRGSLGGLNPKIIEIADLLKAAFFDYIIVETVGVGQSEVEIAGLADISIVVVVPEAGDDIQVMKAGVMEIADLFVVNKSDRPDADLFVTNLNNMLAIGANKKVIKTVAFKKEGVQELYNAIVDFLRNVHSNPKRIWLLVEKAYFLIIQKRMKAYNKEYLKIEIEKELNINNFNLYQFVEKVTTNSS